MLNVQSLSVAFQGETLFEDISFHLKGGDRVGLIGKNGAGKSTLLKLLAGEMAADSGQLASDPDVRIGYLSQDIDFKDDTTLIEEAYKAFTEIRNLEKKLQNITEEMSDRTDYESESYHQLMVDLNELQHRFEIICQRIVVAGVIVFGSHVVPGNHIIRIR